MFAYTPRPGAGPSIGVGMPFLRPLNLKHKVHCAALRADRRFNVPDIHPGLRMKADAKEAGASQKNQDAAYRSGMSRWQDGFWYAVSRFFGHTRVGPKRMRVSRRQRLMERQMEAEQARRQAAEAEIERLRATGRIGPGCESAL